VIAAVSARDLKPSEYFVEIHASESDHTLSFSLWHESAMKYFEDVNVRGDPSGKCLTAIYSVETKKVVKIFGWR
jgi:hypothetical protein